MADFVSRRIAHAVTHTLSVLEGPEGLRLFTLEAPWLGNRPNASCVPAGLYDLRPHSGTRYKSTYALVGGTVGYGGTHHRSACVIHSGSRGRHFKGCIGPGSMLAFDGPDMVLEDSREGWLEWVHAIDQLPRPTLLIEPVSEPNSEGW